MSCWLLKKYTWWNANHSFLNLFFLVPYFRLWRTMLAIYKRISTKQHIQLICWFHVEIYFQGSYFQPFLVHLVRVVMVNGGKWLMMTWFAFSADCSSSRGSYWIWSIDGITAHRLLTYYEGICGFGQDSSEAELFRQFEQNWAACDVWNPPIDKRYMSVCPWFAL